MVCFDLDITTVSGGPVTTPDAARPGSQPAPAAPKKTYHAPKLKDYGSLVKLTAKGSMGADRSSKHF